MMFYPDYGGSEMIWGGNTHGNLIPQTILRSLDILTAVLLLTGQLKITSVFLSSESFGLSLAGPITGYAAEGKTPSAELALDALDVITALLLITDQINVVGPFIGSRTISIVVSGPPFGYAKLAGYLPKTQEFFTDYRVRLMSKFNQPGTRG
jgi:hypothetical protein